MSSATKDKADDAECQRKSLSLNANFALPRATIRARFGFKAVHVGLNYPTEFPRVVSQSGSFWWNESWLSQNLTASGPRIAFRLTVGSDETMKMLSTPITVGSYSNENRKSPPIAEFGMHYPQQAIGFPTMNTPVGMISRNGVPVWRRASSRSLTLRFNNVPCRE